MKINEIFYSIQGEGKWTGKPNIFIRTTGCNLRCKFCDTKYAYTNGKEMTIKEIIKNIQKFPCKKVCITGGEPLLQKEDLKELIKNLFKKKYEIIIETNGSVEIDEISKIKELIVSMDIKCPSSEMHDKMVFENIKNLTKKDQVKFVIKDEKDYEYAKKMIKKYNPKSLIYFQPVWKTKTEKIAEWILKDGLDVILGLQIQKIIWADKDRGV